MSPFGSVNPTELDNVQARLYMFKPAQCYCRHDGQDHCHISNVKCSRLLSLDLDPLAVQWQWQWVSALLSSAALSPRGTVRHWASPCPAMTGTSPSQSRSPSRRSRTRTWPSSRLCLEWGRLSNLIRRKPGVSWLRQDCRHYQQVVIFYLRRSGICFYQECWEARKCSNSSQVNTGQRMWL